MRICNGKMNWYKKAQFNENRKLRDMIIAPSLREAGFFEDNKDPLIIWRKPKYKKNTKLFSIKYNKVVIVEEIDHDNKLNYEYLLKPINGHPSYYEEEWIIKNNYKIIPKGKLTGAIYD